MSLWRWTDEQLSVLLNTSLRFSVSRFPRSSTSAPRLPQKAGEWEEVVSGIKVRRWRLNGLQEEGREDYSSILLLLSEIKESLRINWAQLRSKADLQSETRHQSPSTAAGIWTGNLSVRMLVFTLLCFTWTAGSLLPPADSRSVELFVSFSNLFFYEDRRINLQIIFYTYILKTRLRARPTALCLPPSLSAPAFLSFLYWVYQISWKKVKKKVWENSQW